MIPAPQEVQMIGSEVAILWPDGREDYFPSEVLRACSPSAENRGERDILGHLHGGSEIVEFPGVEVLGWEFVGSYALRFRFSDGHATGLYSYDYLRELGDLLKKK